MLVTIMTVGLAVAIPKPPVDTLRYAGLALQILGIATVMRGLRDRGQLFQKPTLFAQFRNWAGRIPRLNPKPIQLSVNMSSQANASATLSAVVWRGNRKDDSVDARLDALFENIETLRQQLSEETARVLRETQLVRCSIESETQSRVKELTEIRSRLATLGAGGIHIEMVGVIWLFLGAMLATVPGELASFLPPRQ